MKNTAKTILILNISAIVALFSCGTTNGSSTSSLLESSSANSSSSSSSSLTYKEKADIHKELLGSYNFFTDCTNLTEGSVGYGLSQDRLTNKSLSSIASTGFALASYPMFVKEGLMSVEEAKKRVSGTFTTLLALQNNTSESYEGCFYHFFNKTYATHISTSEISTIDTAILLGGVIEAMEYFKDDSAIYTAGNTIWGNVNFKAYEHKSQRGGKLISMGADSSHNLLSADWDMTAEQLMLYVFGAGSPVEAHRLDKTHYDAINKPKNTYDDHEVYYTWNGSIFTYQYSHAFIDFSSYTDANGIDWWANSVSASKANYDYCQDNKEDIKTYGEYSWGLTACDTPLGYNGTLGALPRGGGKSQDYAEIEGTIAPTGALGSILFTPDESLGALGYYQSLESLNDDTYGLRDSYCLDFGPNSKNWYDDDIIGIDKGISTVMLGDYSYKNLSQSLVMSNANITEGLEALGFVKK